MTLRAVCNSRRPVITQRRWCVQAETTAVSVSAAAAAFEMTVFIYLRNAANAQRLLPAQSYAHASEREREREAHSYSSKCCRSRICSVSGRRCGNASFGWTRPQHSAHGAVVACTVQLTAPSLPLILSAPSASIVLPDVRVGVVCAGNRMGQSASVDGHLGLVRQKVGWTAKPQRNGEPKKKQPSPNASCHWLLAAPLSQFEICHYASKQPRFLNRCSLRRAHFGCQRATSGNSFYFACASANLT